MRTSFLPSILSSLAIVSLAACTDAGPSDELADESKLDGEAGKGDSADAFTFFTISPNVGQDQSESTGFQVARVNRAETTCTRGVSGPTCLVNGLDLSGTAMPDSVQASYVERIRNGETFILRGELTPAADDRGVSLSVTEVWAAGSSNGLTDGPVVLVKDNGTRCVQAPCPSLTEYRLNSNRFAEIHEVDLASAGADELSLGAADEQLHSGGVIVIGDRFYGPKDSKGRAASQFFTKAPVPQN